MRSVLQEAADVVADWARAFTALDVDGIVKLYASDATMIGTSGNAVLTTPEQIRDYFDVAFNTSKLRTATLDSSQVLVVDDNTVIIAGLDTVTGVKDGQTIASRGRVTFVVAKRGAAWAIVHLHRSPLQAG